MRDFNERDKELLEKFGMTEEQVSSDVERMESEDAGHGITGPIYYGLHMLPKRDERMVTVTIKMPESQHQQVTAAENRYHIRPSEYIRRHLTKPYAKNDIREMAG